MASDMRTRCSFARSPILELSYLLVDDRHYHIRLHRAARFVAHMGNGESQGSP
jgi:hypothetical protein